jgi:hypothetical protein
MEIIRFGYYLKKPIPDHRFLEYIYRKSDTRHHRQRQWRWHDIVTKAPPVSSNYFSQEGEAPDNVKSDAPDIQRKYHFVVKIRNWWLMANLALGIRTSWRRLVRATRTCRSLMHGLELNDVVNSSCWTGVKNVITISLPLYVPNVILAPSTGMNP